LLLFEVATGHAVQGGVPELELGRRPTLREVIEGCLQRDPATRLRARQISERFDAVGWMVCDGADPARAASVVARLMRIGRTCLEAENERLLPRVREAERIVVLGRWARMRRWRSVSELGKGASDG
jgi:hypothetical protein